MLFIPPPIIEVLSDAVNEKSVVPNPILPSGPIYCASFLVPKFLVKKVSEPGDQPPTLPDDSFLAIIPAKFTELPAPVAPSADTNAIPTVVWSPPLLLYNDNAGINPFIPVVELSSLINNVGEWSPGFLNVAPSH